MEKFKKWAYENFDTKERKILAGLAIAIVFIIAVELLR